MISFLHSLMTADHGAIICLLVMCLWAIIMASLNKLALNRIRKKCIKNANTILGHSVDYWIEKMKSPVEISFDLTQNKVIHFNNNMYFFVSYTLSYLTSNKFGIALGKNDGWCLVAIGEGAIKTLEEAPDLFHCLAQSQENVYAYSIKNLNKFGGMINNNG